MLHSIGRTAVAQVQSLLRRFLQDGAFPFSSVLTVQDIVDLISQTCVETCDRIFTPVVTLCTFLSQIHSDDPALDAQVYPKEDLAGLYRARWHAELELRSIKQTMQMDVLRCKTPAMVRKEIWGHLLVYNLLRAAMAQAALGHRMVPRQVSLQGTHQTLTAFHSQLAQASPSRREGIIQIVLSAIASHRVGTRPDRYEPRACKRRPKPYPLLRVPRQQARARLVTAA
jgi:DDE family transposase